MKSFIANIGVLGMIGVAIAAALTMFSIFNVVFLAKGVDVFGVLRTARAATTGSVAATVTTQIYAITIDTDGTIAFGNMALGATKSSTSGELTNETQTANNSGNQTAKFNIIGTASASWTLDIDGSPTGETYSLEFSDEGASPYTWAYLTTAYQTMTASVTAAATRPLDLRITISSNTAATAQQTANVTVQALAP